MSAKQAFDSHQTLYLIDISSFIFRAFFAIRRLTNKAGEPTNAVYGVAQMLTRLVEEARPEHMAVAYDSKEPSFRKAMYDEYKANRSAPPEDLVPQFAKIDELVRLMNIHSYRLPGVEADDIIATMARLWCEQSPKHRTVIVTGDKDLMQLVNDRIVVWDTMKEKFYRPADVEEKFGVRPDQVRDYLALVGDSSDNIPGVKSIGPKGAVDLLKEHGSLDGVLAAAKSGKVAGKKAEVLQEHEKDARLSAELVALKADVPMKFEEKDFAYAFEFTPDCEKFLLDMDFKSLVLKWKEKGASRAGVVTSAAGGAAPREPRENEAPDRFRSVRTEPELQALLGLVRKTGQFAFDLETTSLNPRAAEIVGFALSCDSKQGYYIPVGHRGDSGPQLKHDQVLDALRPFLENPRYKKLGQNLKYDWSVLMERGVKPDGIGADTMIAAYVLEPGGRYNLEALCEKYLDYKVLTFEEVCGKGKDQIGFDQVPIELATRYSAEDALCVNWLWEKLAPRLHEENLMEVFARVELPLVPVLARMELQGVCIDVPWLKKLSSEFERELLRLQERVSAYAKGPLNLNSPRQLAQLLFEDLKLPTQGKTKTGFSTDASVLEALAPLHEVPRLLLEFREIAKLKGTYVDPLPQMIDAKTGKIHASFHQTVAATGRLSSSDPNLQNIPVRTERGQKIRRAFIPSPGNCLISADYSQIELRILAHMSGDADLIRSFRADEDIHKRTASEIYGINQAEVTDEQRNVAKAINFGLMYGKTAFGLAQELGIPRGQAKEMIDRYFERYSAVKRLLDGQIEQARETGVVTTLLGRRRLLPDIKSKNAAIRANAERMAMNTPIQGTAADLMKIAMIQLDEAILKEGLRARLTIQVHDELVIDCPEDELEQVRALVCKVMEHAMKFEVPLKVNASVGKNWMEL